MNTTTITAAKNGLSALIDRVRGGESILILDRGVPVARLEPVVSSSDPTGRLQRLERAGVLRIKAGRPPVKDLRTPAPRLKAGASVVRALLDERRTGR
jgi:prevent-host-death family protein